MGTEKLVKVTWTPPASFDPNETCRAAINVTTKGDLIRIWRVILVGYAEILTSSDKQSSPGTSQQLTKQLSTIESSSNILTT